MRGPTFPKDITLMLTLAMFATLSAISMGHAATAQNNGPLVQISTKGSVTETVSQLKKIIASNDMMVMGELHQGQALSMTGVRVQSETLFVGNPTVGKQLFSAEPGVGVVVPVRINIYQDAQGHTIVSYARPSALLSTFAKPDVTKVAVMLDGKLQNMLKMITE